MGIKLIVEFMDFGPPTLTASEWKAMVVVLEDANDQSRLTWSAVTDPKILRRIGLSPAAWTNLRGSLVRKGALKVAVPGKRGKVAKYRVPAFAPMGHQIDEETAMGHGIDEESTPMPHETHDESAEKVMGFMTPTPPSSSTTSSSPPPEPPVAADSPSGGGGGGQQEQQHLDRATRFVDTLDYCGQHPSRSQHQRLVKHTDAALAAGWAERHLHAHLSSGLRTADSPLAIYLHRLKPDELPAKPPRLHAAPAPRVRADPTYCGQDGCDYGQIEQPDGSFAPCPCTRKATAA